MIIFYATEFSAASATLQEDEFLHCCKVLRHQIGDQITITDGAGLFGLAEISTIKKNNAVLKVISSELSTDPKSDLQLFVSPPKNRARWEWLLEKTVELGVDTITPLITFHTEKIKINEKRSQKIIRSAALQSKRTYHPQLRPAIKFKDFIKGPWPSDSDKYLAHYQAKNPDLIQQETKGSSVLFLIGPEGDFSDQEVIACQDAGFVTVNISANRLRTETAAIAIVNILKQLRY